MIYGDKIIQFTGCINDLMDSRVAEFNNLSCFNINKMIVLSALISSFKLSNILPELMLDYQIAVEQ